MVLVALTVVPAVLEQLEFTANPMAPHGLSLTSEGSNAQMVNVPVAPPLPHMRT